MKKTSPYVLSLILATFLCSCGGKAYRETPPTHPTASEPTPGGDSGGNSGGNSGGGSGNSTETAPPITKTFSITGSGGTQPSFSTTVSTDNLLKIRVKAGPGDRLSLPESTYSNFYTNYSCITYNVSALGQSMVTQTLSVSTQGVGASYNYVCSQAPNEQVLDFSGRLGAGHHSVTIIVTVSGYDFYCKNCTEYPWLYNYNCNLQCPLKSIYKTHTVTGSLEIQVNGTTL